MTDFTATAQLARLIREDCAKDAEAVDRTPFTPKGVGPLFGALLAQVAALAKCVEQLAEAQAECDEKRYALDAHGHLEVPLRKE